MSTAPFEYSGFGFPSWWNGNFGTADSLASLKALVTTGSNSISIVPTTYISTITSSDFHATAQTESAANVRAQILQAHSLGLTVILKPHVDALDGSAFRGEFKPTDVNAWFSGYKALILSYAQIAQETGVKTLCIGTEYDNLSGAAYRSQWTDIIASVRQVYGGTITYAATAMAAKDVSFWDQVDLIGVNTYYRMSDSTTATVEDYKATWTSLPTSQWELSITEGKTPVDFLRDLSFEYGKPLFLAEVGYRSMDGAAIDPGIWNSTGAVDLQEQVNLYKALFETFTTHGGDWFAGMQLWNWDVNSWGTNNTGYSPQDKPALQVVTDWFSGNLQASGLTLVGTDVGNALHGGLGADVLRGSLGNDVLNGGGGSDVLVGGPDTLANIILRASTTLTVTAKADVLNGVGAKFHILVNGVQTGGVFEAMSALSDFSVSFANTIPVTSVGVRFVNDEFIQGVGDRNLYVNVVAVNGNVLPLSEAVNPTGNGQGAMWWNSTLSIDTTAKQEFFTSSSTDADILRGGAGDDLLIGGAGNDFLDGGDGTDTASHMGLRSQYAVSRLADGDFRVNDLRADSPEGMDTLRGVEFLRFADGTFSLTQLAGTPVVPPPPPLPTVTAISTDTGISVTDRITSDNTLSFTGTAGAGRVVNIMLDGALVGIAAADASGTWNFDHSKLVLADGLHLLTARDPSGSSSQGFAFTVDTRAPAGSFGNFWTANGMSTASGLAEAVGTVGVTDATGKVVATVVTAADGTWSVALGNIGTAALTFGLSVTDAAGNVGNDGGRLFTGSKANDVLTGTAGQDLLNGGTGNDVLTSGGGNDVLHGGGGNDVLSGGDGADRLYGGTGADRLSGGAGQDLFVLASLSESPLNAWDIITDFALDDRIDLSAIDAVTNVTGNQAFTWTGTRAFSGVAGELHVETFNGKTFVAGDVNGDRTADFRIESSVAYMFSAPDFIL